MPNQVKGKHDFEDIYTSDTCVKYYHVAMKEMCVIERCEVAAKYSEKFLLPLFRKWAKDPSSGEEKALQFMDLLSCYGNDTLIYTNSYYQADFDKTWSSESTCETLVKPRQFPVKTLGVDRSENALKFGKKVGVFDDIAVIDFNNLTCSNEQFLEERCKNANILIMNSFVYIDDGIVEQIINWFALGTEPGMIIFGFIYPYDGVERMNQWKKMLLEKFDFFSSVPAVNRVLDEEERSKHGKEYGVWEKSFYEFWHLTRKV